MPIDSLNNYELNYEIRPNYLLARIDLTEHNYNIARQYWTDLVRLVHQRRYRKVIVEISAPTALPPKEEHSLMIDVTKRIVPDIRIAIVNPRVVEMARSAVESSAMVAGRSMKIVDTLADAEAWLRDSESHFNTGTMHDIQDLTGHDMMQ